MLMQCFRVCWQKMIFEFKPLYSRQANGKLCTWTCESFQCWSLGIKCLSRDRRFHIFILGLHQLVWLNGWLSWSMTPHPLAIGSGSGEKIERDQIEIRWSLFLLSDLADINFEFLACRLFLAGTSLFFTHLERINTGI